MKILDGGAWANGINRSISTTSIAINQLAFIHGSSTANGGGLMADGNIDLYISDSEILWCVAASGGGIFTDHGVSLAAFVHPFDGDLCRSWHCTCGQHLHLIDPSCVYAVETRIFSAPN